MNDRIIMIERRLRMGLKIDSLDIVDQSHLHAGHPGAASGGGHFDLTVISEDFTGLDKLTRHRKIYQALGEAMTTDIHALSIKAFCPGEK